jgi:NAD/NADP octopine/nopaline dehydrogenase, alpha-helical domain
MSQVKASVFQRRDSGLPSLTICGGGNAGHALAVVASQTLAGDIDWLVGSEEKADRLRRSASADGLRATGVVNAKAHRLRVITADPAAVIPHADMILLVVPAFAHGAVLRRIKPFITETTPIGCIPTRGGFEFQVAQLHPGRTGARATIFGLQTLPWSTRVITLGEVVHIGAVKAKVVLASLPAAEGAHLAPRLSALLQTEVVATQNFLSLSFANPGQIVHPGLMYGHFHAWCGEEFTEDNIPMLYAGVTEAMGDLVERLSADVLAVARAVEAQSGDVLKLQGVIVPIHEWLRQSYGRVTADSSTVATCFKTGPIRTRKAPMIEVRSGRFVPNFQYRYLSEDVPFGLVVTRAFAEIVDVHTPAIDEVVAWAQRMLHKVYLVDGELRGPDACDLPIPQNCGILSVPELVDWYTAGAYSHV